ncbi:hypothetical protein FQN54_001789 [Arachnomyces sp. PD_36]|nr:hypothetical protein FQN54_001789 [Arachnomyces sp. PD_36]
MAQGRISSGGDDEPNEVHVPAPYPVKPLVGSSIGTSHHAGRTGTLGGYVELVKEGSIKSCALTCASVAAPPNGMVQTSQVESGEGVVFSPSTTDHEASIARFKSDVAHLKDYRDTVEKESARSETPDRFASKLEFANNEIDRFEKKISETVDADREIGSIFSESESKILSEYASKGSRRIDWGLIELKAERVGTNTVRDANTWFRGGTQILGVTFPLPYQHVFKVGRSSETTRGIINGVQSCLSYGQNGREKHMEWAVVGQNDIGRPFSYCGDSGALILEQFFPRTLGLLWGGMDNGEQWGRGHDRSYFTPIGAVAEHILQTTGYHVQIQGGSDICCDPVLTKFAK